MVGLARRRRFVPCLDALPSRLAPSDVVGPIAPPPDPPPPPPEFTPLDPSIIGYDPPPPPPECTPLDPSIIGWDPPPPND